MITIVPQNRRVPETGDSAENKTERVLSCREFSCYTIPFFAESPAPGTLRIEGKNLPFTPTFITPPKSNADDHYCPSEPQSPRNGRLCGEQDRKGSKLPGI